jgi:hypothetical protein
MLQQWGKDNTFELEAKITMGAANDLKKFREVVETLRENHYKVVSADDITIESLGSGFETCTDTFYDHGLRDSLRVRETVRVSFPSDGMRKIPIIKKPFGRTDIILKETLKGDAVVRIGVCLTQENELKDFITPTQSQSLVRLKERISFVTPDERTRIDCTRVREALTATQAKNAPFTYEIEVEFLHKTNNHVAANSAPLELLESMWTLCTRAILGLNTDKLICFVS